MAGASIMDTLFQRTLDDLIKGLRLTLVGDAPFIAKAMDEIRREAKSTDLDTKAAALQKLSYLSSLHSHDMSFASFHVVELLSSTKFAHKRIAYHSASLSFDESTPVIVLVTNQLRKDLSSKSEYEVSLALECLSRIGTVDLARDLSPEVFTLLASSKVSVRKRAIAAVLRVFEKYPDAARVCFKRLVESLESSEVAVLSAAVGVFSELSARDPASYLPLAPEFYRVLVDCKNNWVLIKVLKIFSRLAPLEPRLAKRVVEPICDLMKRTVAKSVIFECIRTVVSSFSGYESAVRLAVEKIREFLVEDDPNLKFLALNALSTVSPSHLWPVLENKEVVIKSLSDLDPNIRRESLRLVMAMVSESNVAEISRVLLNYAMKSDPVFCNEILGSILSTCSANVYEIIVDFDWYVSLLGEMSRVSHCQKGDEIERQLVDIGMRVQDVRPELVRVSRDLLIDPVLLGNLYLHRILSASAWISGQYVEFSRNPLELVDALLQPRTNLLPPSVRAVYVQSVFKVLVFSLHCVSLNANKLEEGLDPRDLNQSFDAISDDNDEENVVNTNSVADMLDKIKLAVGLLSGSHDPEVLERVRNLLCYAELVKREEFKADKKVVLMRNAFADDLGPVSTSAQGNVILPDGLILKENLDELDSILPEIRPPSSNRFSLESLVQEGISGSSTFDTKDEFESTNESSSLLSEHRKRHGLYYLPSEKNGTSNDYPPANEVKSRGDDEDLVKLTEESLVSKKKPNHRMKPRPVVVKLDGDAVPSSAKPLLKDDSLSEAVREALLGTNSKSESLQNKSSKGKEILNSDTRELTQDDGSNPTTRKSKSQSHGKSRKQRSLSKVGDENGDEVKKTSHHRHGSKHKSRSRTEAVPQAAVIPDFLL